MGFLKATELVAPMLGRERENRKILHIIFLKTNELVLARKNVNRKNLDHIPEIGRVSRRSAVDKKKRKVPHVRDRAYRKVVQIDSVPFELRPEKNNRSVFP